VNDGDQLFRRLHLGPTSRIQLTAAHGGPSGVESPWGGGCS
jgi:hypothetical protein